MGNFQGGGRNNDRGGDRGNNRGGFGGNRSGGRPSFQKKEWGGRDNRETVMHKATCGECNKACEVPFRPTGDKPVLCNECFGGKKDTGFGAKKSFDNRFEERAPFGPKKSSGDREMRPIREFKAPNPNAGAFSDEVKKTLSEMNSKLDRLVTTLEKLAAAGQIDAVLGKKDAQTAKMPAPKPLPAPVRKVSTAPTVKKGVAKTVVKKVAAVKPTVKTATKVVKKVVVKKVVAKKVTKK
jgi:CxxC-x17-CxxC domain-containing protein